jgi:hypothetical protein
MTPDDKKDLRDLRNDTIDPEDKKLLRKTLNYIQALEAKLHSTRTLARAIQNEAQLGKGADDE